MQLAGGIGWQRQPQLASTWCYWSLLLSCEKPSSCMHGMLCHQQGFIGVVHMADSVDSAAALYMAKGTSHACMHAVLQQRFAFTVSVVCKCRVCAYLWIGHTVTTHWARTHSAQHHFSQNCTTRTVLLHA
jgi:hypothetical protein